MSNTSSPHYVEIGQLITCDPEEVYCPICGQKLVKEGKEVTSVIPCKHLAFFYLPSVDAFEYKSDDFAKRIEPIEIDELDYDNFKEFLIEAGYDNSMLALELTYGGIACGPVSFTIVVGYDYSTIAS